MSLAPSAPTHRAATRGRRRSPAERHPWFAVRHRGDRRRVPAAVPVVAACWVATVVGATTAVAGARPDLALVAVAWAVLETVCVSVGDAGRGALSLRRVGRRVVLLLAGLAVLAAVTGHGAGLGTQVAALAACALLSVGIRVLLRSATVRARLDVRVSRRVVVVASSLPSATELDERLARSGADVVGFVAPWSEASWSAAGAGGQDELVDLVVRAGADLVVAHPGIAHVVDLERMTWALEDVGVRLALAPVPGMAAHRITPTQVGSATAVDIMPSRPRAVVRLSRRVTDLAVAAVLLVLLAPVLLLIGVLVRLDSPGPALFRQQRVKAPGACFTMLKFRTMRTDAEKVLDGLRAANVHGHGVLFKLQDDPRVTRVGRVLRRTSLDELPQLLNVLRGDMSLVGPRPALPSEVARYDDRAARRLRAKPGLTGLWQVSGRSDLTWQESVDVDVDYVDNWSPVRDLRILLRTIKVVLSRNGAY
ncbi:exopolysaccharide biosynthesis polyprenyl glycosylphosphotransferase [Marmoricola sp. RAF53]|uniref:exopolysaccharide biosynthesis polyprenyl glycosylphosphotransferase n=1 Tax=Marmoricola sp. RAF53 TaxID=3233059 RepID=UPI003F947DFC